MQHILGESWDQYKTDSKRLKASHNFSGSWLFFTYICTYMGTNRQMCLRLIFFKISDISARTFFKAATLPAISPGTGEMPFLTSRSVGFENISAENSLIFLQGSDEQMRSGRPRSAKRWQTGYGLSWTLEMTYPPSTSQAETCGELIWDTPRTCLGILAAALLSLFPPLQPSL